MKLVRKVSTDVVLKVKGMHVKVKWFLSGYYYNIDMLDVLDYPDEYMSRLSASGTV